MQLAHALLGYSPVIDQRRVVAATRLAIVEGDALHPLDAAKLYAELSALWPRDAGPLIIDAAGVEPNHTLLPLDPRANVWLGVPAEALATEQGAGVIRQLHAAGFPLVQQGRLAEPLPADLAVAFKMVLVPQGSGRGVKGSNTTETDVLTIAAMQAAFEAGAYAVSGFPVGKSGSGKDRSGNNPSFDVIGKLMKMVNAGADPDDMDKVVRQDPALAFRLLRYLNSPAFGLRVEVQSIQHAIMMLGLTRLKKWLALLLATAARDPNLKPLMFASLRRGFLLETMVADAHAGEGREEAFILGVFSLLDQLFGESFEALFERLQIPEAVYDALVNGNGSFMPYLKLARVLEQSPGKHTDEVLTESFIATVDCNRALVSALASASVTENGA